MAAAEGDKFKLHALAKDGNSSSDFALSILKADQTSAYRTDSDGRLPIHWAASSNNYDIVSVLADHPRFDPEAQDDSGWTPLMIAASRKDGDTVVRALLAKGANVNQKNSSGQTALHLAASKNNVDVAKMLLGHDTPATTTVRDKRGQQPIHRAAAAGSTQTLKLLVEHKSPLNGTDVWGFTPLHLAIAEGHGDTAIVLIKAGADVSKMNNDDQKAIDIAPDVHVRRYVVQMAEKEGVDLE